MLRRLAYLTAMTTAEVVRLAPMYHRDNDIEILRSAAGRARHPMSVDHLRSCATPTQATGSLPVSTRVRSVPLLGSSVAVLASGFSALRRAY